MKQEKLNKILNEHKLWLSGNDGARANLQDADLQYADLQDANLQGADLQGANLWGANLKDVNLKDADLRNVYLRGADLQGADLRGANLWSANLQYADLQGANLQGADLWHVYLRGTNLQGADLRGANLQGADLWRADLRDANLQGADLQGANLWGAYLQYADLWGAVGVASACPEEGPFIAFKKARFNNQDVIVKLQIPDDAKRSSATGRKCRCDKALVLEISDITGIITDFTHAKSFYDNNFVYKVGEIVSVNSFDENRWNECASGIHFYITRQEAVEY